MTEDRSKSAAGTPQTANSFDFMRLQESIEVCSYDPAWTEWYVCESARIKEIFGESACALEHVGSSSVPGLESKPIVDILVGMNQLVITSRQEAALVGQRYEYFGRLHAEQERLFARKRGLQSFNLQIVPYGAHEWDEKILFRDYLRAHPRAVAEYAQIKRDALKKGIATLLEYNAFKEATVKSLVAEALQWRRSGMGRGVV